MALAACSAAPLERDIFGNVYPPECNPAVLADLHVTVIETAENEVILWRHGRGAGNYGGWVGLGLVVIGSGLHPAIKGRRHPAREDPRVHVPADRLAGVALTGVCPIGFRVKLGAVNFKFSSRAMPRSRRLPKDEMTPSSITSICQLCGRRHFFGDDHRYYGKFISAYKMQVCSGCLDGNSDGLAPHLEKTFETHLTKMGIPFPKRNSKGWYPLPMWS